MKFLFLFLFDRKSVENDSNSVFYVDLDKFNLKVFLGDVYVLNKLEIFVYIGLDFV